MFGYAILDGIAAGLLSRMYALCAQLAWEYIQRSLSADSLLHGVSVVTPPGDARHYDGIGTGSALPWGQGPVLRFALATGAMR